MAKSKQERKKGSEEEVKPKGKQDSKSKKDDKFVEEKVPVRLLEHYRTKIIPELKKGSSTQISSPTQILHWCHSPICIMHL